MKEIIYRVISYFKRAAFFYISRLCLLCTSTCRMCILIHFCCLFILLFRLIIKNWLV